MSDKRYRKRTTTLGNEKSFFDRYPKLTTNQYWIPKAYLDSVMLVIQLYRSGVSFNKSVDQAFAAYQGKNKLNRNKLAEHTLKYIANDY